MHHASVEVNIVISVVLGELHVVVRVHVPLVCDDAVIGLTLGLIAHVLIVVFVVAICPSQQCDLHDLPVES